MDDSSQFAQKDMLSWLDYDLLVSTQGKCQNHSHYLKQS